MQRQVKWLGQTTCSNSSQCPYGLVCKNGKCMTLAEAAQATDFGGQFPPSESDRDASSAPAPPKIDPRLIPQIQLPPKKTDNTVLWVLGSLLGAGVLYYAVQ